MGQKRLAEMKKITGLPEQSTETTLINIFTTAKDAS
jgi:hypothetical protein